MHDPSLMLPIRVQGNEKKLSLVSRELSHHAIYFFGWVRKVSGPWAWAVMEIMVRINIFFFMAPHWLIPS